jgi:hypothetical protein
VLASSYCKDLFNFLMALSNAAYYLLITDKYCDENATIYIERAKNPQVNRR